ncbi:MAG: hypothetical protein NPIRA03_06670 [Nitrospirales bacterium]|nr:MAG: hypothetical protein NPIRA03_06670 [Nitrospirales bacterium]
MAKKSITPKIKTLTVPYRETLGDFLREARSAWRDLNPKPKKKTGRPSEQQQVFEICDSILLANGNAFPIERLEKVFPYNSVSVGNWVLLVQKQTKTAQLPEGLAKNTIWRHFTAWLIEEIERQEKKIERLDECWNIPWPLMVHAFRNNFQILDRYRLLFKFVRENSTLLFKQSEDKLSLFFTGKEISELEDTIYCPWEILLMVPFELAPDRIVAMAKSKSLPKLAKYTWSDYL